MYVTDVRHFLDEKGAIGPKKGPGKVFAQFIVGIVSSATDRGARGVASPKCFKCKQVAVAAVVDQDACIVWSCPACHSEGRISNWRGTLWDLTAQEEQARA